MIIGRFVRNSVFLRALTVTLLWIIVLCALEAFAIAPSDEAIARWTDEGTLENKLGHLKSFKELGGCTAEHGILKRTTVDGLSLSAGSATIDTMRTLVLLIDFSDWPASGQGTFGTGKDFDSILFSNRETDSIANRTGSMTDYYLENSYGHLLIQGDIVGWLRMPRTYAWYEGGDDGLTRGRYLAYDAAMAAEAAGIDFSQYDHDGDSTCDGLILVHSGAGAEAGGYGIWSHKWTVSPSVTLDGVVVSAYTMNPEEDGSTGRLSSIGVFCHEFGHFLGLPDLYDIDGVPAGSQGLGRWSLMAAGSYNGNSRTPAHLDAWCKAELGFVTPITVTQNIHQASIPEVEHNPVVYKLQNAACGPYEYFLVENRSLTGFDVGLPSPGLLIYHIDLSAPTENRDNLRYFVALEQADGRNDLAFGSGNRGDGGDPWHTGTSTEFFSYSAPSSFTNDGIKTGIAVGEISDVDSVMYANLDISASHPWFVVDSSIPPIFSDNVPDGDGDGLFEAGETISLSTVLRNLMRPGFNYQFAISGNPSLVTSGATRFAQPVNSDTAAIFPEDPVTFTVRDNISPIIDTVWLEITCDSLPSVAGGSRYSQQFPFEIALGAPEVLVVDDDRGATFELVYTSSLNRLRVPHAVWNIATQGVPAISNLRDYPSIIWFTGDSTGGAIDARRMSSMKSAMSNGLSLMLVTSSAAADMASLDSMFMANYFGARYVDTSLLHPLIASVDSGRIFDSTAYFYRSDYPVHRRQMVIEAIGDGQVALRINHTWPCATFMDGSIRSLLLTIPLENINDLRLDPVDTLLARALVFLGRPNQPASGGREESTLVPSTFTLMQNYPNPFNPTTTIAFEVHADDAMSPVNARLDIFNVLVERVAT
ncbi:MAG: M6 family metalloprotease domain-containing protein, partial [Candidatus Zixiibacteriota bacterium]